MRKKLGRLVQLTLANADVVGVVALTDVYPAFKDANEAKEALQRAAAPTGRDPKFRAHAAQFELKAWILPFWKEIAKTLGVDAAAPGARPEEVNSERPPSRRLMDLYARAKQRYEKVVDGPKWLTAARLETAAGHCPQLKSFLSSLLELAGATPLA